MNTKQKIILIIIIILAAILRIVNLDQVPPHLSNDEISIAYDAYSVSKTLRDEHNNFLPISFQSHNTYKAPLAIYLAIPSTILLGNNEYAVRLPSAILGTLTVLMLFLLVYELTKNANLALLSSFILTITPVHIYTSRMALESNIALFFVVTGIYLFFKGLHTNKALFTVFSFIAFAFSIYGYHSEWIFTPLIIFTMFFLYPKKFLSNKVYSLSLVLFVLLILPIFVDYLNQASTNRASTENFFQEPAVKHALANSEFNIFQKIQILLYAVLANYSRYTSMDFLFLNGLNIPIESSILQVGLLLIVFLPCFAIGIFQIKKYFKEYAGFIIVWALLAPVAAVLTRGKVNYIRDLVAVVPYVIIISLGAYQLWINTKNVILRIIYCVLLFFSFTYFILIYFINFPIQASENYQYGYKQAALYLNSLNVFEKIVIDPKFGRDYSYAGVPHLYFSYYTYIDPQKFLNERRDLPTGLYFGNYEIREINWNIESTSSGSIYIVPTSNSPKENVQKYLDKIHSINLLNGNPAFEIWRSKN